MLNEKPTDAFTHSVVLAETHTSAFRFQGVGRTHEQALQALLDGWDAHVREHTVAGSGPDPGLMRARIAEGEFLLTTLRTGEAYRDGQRLT